MDHSAKLTLYDILLFNPVDAVVSVVAAVVVVEVVKEVAAAVIPPVEEAVDAAVDKEELKPPPMVEVAAAVEGAPKPKPDFVVTDGCVEASVVDVAAELKKPELGAPDAAGFDVVGAPNEKPDVAVVAVAVGAGLAPKPAKPPALCVADELAAGAPNEKPPVGAAADTEGAAVLFAPNENPPAAGAATLLSAGLAPKEKPLAPPTGADGAAAPNEKILAAGVEVAVVAPDEAPKENPPVPGAVVV